MMGRRKKWDLRKTKSMAGDYISLSWCSRTTVNMKLHIGSSGMSFNCDRTICRAIIVGVIISPRLIKIEKYISLLRRTQTVLCFGNK